MKKGRVREVAGRGGLRGERISIAFRFAWFCISSVRYLFGVVECYPIWSHVFEGSG